MTIKYLMTKNGNSVHTFPKFHLEALKHKNQKSFMMKQSPWDLFPSLAGLKKFKSVGNKQFDHYVWKPVPIAKVDIYDIIFKFQFAKKNKNVLLPELPRFEPVPEIQQPVATTNDSTPVDAPSTFIIVVMILATFVSYKLVKRLSNER